MMIWSKRGIPKSSPAALMRDVMLKSSSDGVGSPEGWLCARMIDAALVRMAGLKTSLGCTKDDVRVPIDTVLMAVIRCFPFNMITKQCSRSASHSNGFMMCAMSFGSLILFVTVVTCPSLTASSFIWRILYMAVTLLLFCYFCYAGDTVRSASKDVSDIFYTLRTCRKTQSVTTPTGQSNNHHVKTLLSFKKQQLPPQPPPSQDQRGRLGGSTGYPSFKDEEGKGYDKRGVPLADPLLSSYRKRITGTAGVMDFIGLGLRQGLDG